MHSRSLPPVNYLLHICYSIRVHNPSVRLKYLFTGPKLQYSTVPSVSRPDTLIPAFYLVRQISDVTKREHVTASTTHKLRITSSTQAMSVNTIAYCPLLGQHPPVADDTTIMRRHAPSASTCLLANTASHEQAGLVSRRLFIPPRLVSIVVLLARSVPLILTAIPIRPQLRLHSTYYLTNLSLLSPVPVKTFVKALFYESSPSRLLTT